MIDWTSSESIVLINPRAPETDRHQSIAIEKFLKDLKEHFAIATSGTSGKLKWTALAKSAVLSSAAAVNRHLESTKYDMWLNPLPLFHVGGLGILARSHLSGSGCVNCTFPAGKWSAESFLSDVKKTNATLTSLVPSHVFDLVKNQMTSPGCLRAVVVGGGALSHELYRSATQLGWKLLPSYGLTECASQVATAALGSWEKGEYPQLEPLDHVELKISAHSNLLIKSQALLSGYIEMGTNGYFLNDPKVDEWLLTEDIATLIDGKIIKIGRANGFIKTGGESVDMNRLEGILQQVMLESKHAGDAVLIPVDDQRLGYVIGLKATLEMHKNLEVVIEAYNARVFPYERIRSVEVVESISRTALGKKILS